MDLSREDSLRLHVLLKQDLQAVRIDESAMVLHALTGEGEARVPLNPTCRDEIYLRKVRELLSTHVLGSPGGYPVYLRRWTRMGQARADNLDRLLLLGEPEAVVAVVHAEGLTDELARRAWWAMPTAENARRMLEHEHIARGGMGPELAAFLLEFLPFEEDSRAIVDSVRLVLQPGLVDEATRDKLWKRARQKTTYYAGFLWALPDDLPDPLPAHPALEAAAPRLQPLADSGNPVAALLLRVLGAPGQTFVHVAREALRKPRDQDVAVILFDVVGGYFRGVRHLMPESQDVADLERAADALVESRAGALAAVLEAAPELAPQAAAVLLMSRVGEPLLRPIFARTDAIGTVMRRKLEPLTGPIDRRMACLLAAGAA